MTKKKALEISIIVSLFCGSPFMVQAIDTLTTQGEVESNLNTPLQSGNVTFSTSGTTSDTHFSQIRSSEPLTIQGDAGGNRTLDLRGTLPGTNRHWLTLSNAESRNMGRDITFRNLDTVKLNITGNSHGQYGAPEFWSANIFADNGGKVTFDSSVKTLDVTSSAGMANEDTKSNILAESGGTIEIYSPQVLIHQGSNYMRDSINAIGDNAAIHLGDEEHILDDVTIRAHGENGIKSKAESDNDIESSASVSVFTKKLSISDTTYGIGSEGIENKIQKHALVQVGNEDHPADEISIESSIFGVDAQKNGQADLYGKRIITRSTTGLYASRGAHIRIAAGSNENEGLFLYGHRMNTHDDGMLVGYGNTSQVDVISGNVLIDYFDNGVEMDGNYAASGGIVNFGTSASPINDVTIRNIKTAGIFSGNPGHGFVNINAKNLSIEDNVATPVALTYNTHVNIHTTGRTVLAGTSGTSIRNFGGYIEVNTNDTDGITDITGIVATLGKTDRATTDITFHDARSHFNGNVYDSTETYGGDTTINLLNGAVWNVDLHPVWTERPSLVSTYTSILNTLNLSGGTVNLGGNETYLSTGSRRSLMRANNLTGNGGHWIFRTNLQESADTHTVNGHSDQLYITRSSAGTHTIMVHDSSRTLGRAAENGYVLLVNDQSRSHGAVFRGDANLQNGGLFARRAEITNEAPDASLGYTDVPTTGNNWYLRLVGDRISPTPTINAENNKTFSRSRYGALWIEQETLRQRLGELRDHKQDDGIWARITRGEYTMNGVSGNADYTMYHIGYDKKIGSQKGHKQYIGAAYHHTDTDLNYRHFTDDSDMDADIGTIYYTNLGDKGHYLDIIGKFGRMKGKMKTFGEFPESAKWDSPFYSLSAEYGRKILYDNGWYWEPQVQLTYSHLGSDNYLTSQGTHAHLNNINSLIFRTGFTVGKKNGRNEYYGKVFWHHEFEGAEDTYFHDKNDDRLHDSYDFGSSWVTVGLGGQVGLSKDAYLYGDVEKSFGGDVKKKWAWNIGVRFGF